MDDLISRQAALDWLKNEWNGMVTSLFDGIKALPSAQPDMSEYSDKLWKAAYERGKAEAQPDLDEVYAHAETEAEARYHDDIVRCKHCKYNSNTCGNYVNCDIIPQMFGRTVDNFCSYAERRTDE